MVKSAFMAGAAGAVANSYDDVVMRKGMASPSAGANTWPVDDQGNLLELDIKTFNSLFGSNGGGISLSRRISSQAALIDWPGMS